EDAAHERLSAAPLVVDVRRPTPTSGLRERPRRRRRTVSSSSSSGGGSPSPLAAQPREGGRLSESSPLQASMGRSASAQRSTTRVASDSPRRTTTVKRSGHAAWTPRASRRLSPDGSETSAPAAHEAAGAASKLSA